MSTGIADKKRNDTNEGQKDIRKKDETGSSIAWLCLDCVRDCKQVQADIISCPRYTRQLTLKF